MDLKGKDGKPISLEFGNNGVSLDANKLDDASVQAMQAEADAVIKLRGLNVGAYAGSAALSSIENTIRADIESQVKWAHKAYSYNVATINSVRGATRIDVLKPSKFKEGVMDTASGANLSYMAEVFEKDKNASTRFIVKSAPNTQMNAKDVISLAGENARLLGKPLYRWAGRAAFLGKFSETELLGFNNKSNSLVNHLFAPSKLTPELTGTVKHQQDTFAKLNIQHPGATILAPAVGQSVGGWAIHKETGLSIPANFDTTYDRSVGVEAQSIDGNLGVPRSVVSGGGANVGDSWVGDRDSGRAWVGQNLSLAA